MTWARQETAHRGDREQKECGALPAKVFSGFDSYVAIIARSLTGELENKMTPRERAGQMQREAVDKYNYEKTRWATIQAWDAACQEIADNVGDLGARAGTNRVIIRGELVGSALALLGNPFTTFSLRKWGPRAQEFLERFV